MKRRATLNLNYMTERKRKLVDRLIDEYLRYVNAVIDLLWEREIFYGIYAPKEILSIPETWLTERYKQCAGKQALSIVKSQRKKRRKTKPVLRKASLELDSRLIKIEKGHNSFDLWVKLMVAPRQAVHLPTKRHRVFNKLADGKLKTSARLRRNEKGYGLAVFFEKLMPKPKAEGRPLRWIGAWR